MREPLRNWKTADVLSAHGTICGHKVAGNRSRQSVLADICGAGKTADVLSAHGTIYGHKVAGNCSRQSVLTGYLRDWNGGVK